MIRWSFGQTTHHIKIYLFLEDSDFYRYGLKFDLHSRFSQKEEIGIKGFTTQKQKIPATKMLPSEDWTQDLKKDCIRPKW